jgi:hypothetical protein
MADSENRYTMRAILAAALIESKTVDVSSVFFDAHAAASNPPPSIEKLKIAVDMLLNGVVYK